MSLPQTDFDKVRRWTPLVSIDLVVTDPKGRVLLGRRRNEPAKGSWFVPGGRIRKDETLDDAFSRIVSSEFGATTPVSCHREDSTLLGAFDHLYPASEHTTTDTSIHYVVLGHRLFAPAFGTSELPIDQHDAWRWFTRDDLLRSDSVHVNTKGFFMETRTPAPSQYDTVANRRIAYDNLLWQTPVLSLTAQAFLFTIAFSDFPAITRLPASILVVLVSAASLQLMAKHQAAELDASKRLEAYERGATNFAVVHVPLPRANLSWFASWKSYGLWIVLLWCFLIAGGWAVATCIFEWCGCEWWQQLSRPACNRPPLLE